MPPRQANGIDAHKPAAVEVQKRLKPTHNKIKEPPAALETTGGHVFCTRGMPISRVRKSSEPRHRARPAALVVVPCLALGPGCLAFLSHEAARPVPGVQHD